MYELVRKIVREEIERFNQPGSQTPSTVKPNPLHIKGFSTLDGLYDFLVDAYISMHGEPERMITSYYIDGKGEGKPVYNPKLFSDILKTAETDSKVHGTKPVKNAIEDIAYVTIRIHNLTYHIAVTNNESLT